MRVNDSLGVQLTNNNLVSNEYYFNAGTDYDTATWEEIEPGVYFVYINISNPSAPTREPSQAFTNAFYSFSQFPQNRLFVLNSTTPLTYAGQAGTMGNPYQYSIRVNEAPPASPTTLENFSFVNYTIDYNYLTLDNNNLETSVTGDCISYAGVNFNVFANDGINLTTGNFNFRIYTNDNNNSHSWAFTTKGFVEFPQGVGPASSKGSPGDEVGSVAFNSTYIYYCTQTYTDGVLDIWKRVQWGTETW